jgi:N-carbamoyl-L-amino-acid hydrolase
MIRFEAARHLAFLEAHIEQGPLLEARGIDIGIVEEIVGLRRHWVGSTGRADHACTTPMGMRRDAGRALFDFAGRLDQGFREIAGPDSVWNLGVVEVQPGAGNVVPAVARVLVEFHDRSPEALARMGQAVLGLVETMHANAAIPVTITAAGDLPVTTMDRAMADLIDDAARSLGASTLRMASGAGHDAMVLARHVPASMLFVPSISGRSHDVAEDTHEHDIRRGARVYGAAVARILQAMAREQGAPEAGLPAQPNGNR